MKKNKKSKVIVKVLLIKQIECHLKQQDQYLLVINSLIQNKLHKIIKIMCFQNKTKMYLLQKEFNKDI